MTSKDQRDLREEGWRRSVDNALMNLQTSGRYLRIDPNNMTMIANALGSVRAGVMARYAVEPIALKKIWDVQTVTFEQRVIMQVGLLVQRGLGVPEALRFWKNLRFAIGANINPHAMQLWNREQIVEELGSAFGHPVASAIADPPSNPVLHALMFKTHGVQLYRSASLAWCVATVTGERGKSRVAFTPPSGIREGEVPTPDQPLTDLTVGAAEGYYRSATDGMHLDFTFCLDPVEMDYADEAEKAVRETDGDGDDPRDRRAPPRRRYLSMWSP